MKIRIHDFTGDDCALGEDGEKIYDIAHSELLAGGDVVMDFEGVQSFASPCLNVAIGKLLADISSEILNQRLIFENVAASGETRIKQVIDNAKVFYADPELHRSIVGPPSQTGDEE